MLVSAHGSWHGAPETLGMPGWWECPLSQCDSDWAPGWLLDGDWSRERLSHDQRLGIFSPLAPPSLEEGGGLERKLLVDHASLMKPP